MNAVRRAPSQAGVALVFLWRWTFGLFTPAGTCKYHPSCSQYAIDALRKDGLVQGLREGRLAPASLQPVVEGRGGLPVTLLSLVYGISSILQPIEDAVRWMLERFHYNVGLPWAWAIVGDDDRRADPARAADGEADPLDAVAPEARAGDEGAAEEVQGRPREAERGDDEVLQGEQHQPGRLVPAAARAAAGVLRAVLRPQGLLETRRPARPRRGCTSSRASPTRRTRTGRATCCSRSTPAARCSRRSSCRRRWTRCSAGS